MKSKIQVCLHAAALTAALAILPAIARSQTPDAGTQMDQGSQKMMGSPDMTFATKAAQGGLAEVQLGQLAAQKASDPQVKQFGQRMVDDHGKANSQLMSIAQAQNTTLPTTLDSKHQEEYNKLQGMSGTAFDRAYVNDMVKDHEEDIKEFQKEAKKGNNPQLKNFAEQTLPILREHLKMIRGIQSQNPSNPAEQ